MQYMNEARRARRIVAAVFQRLGRSLRREAALPGRRRRLPRLRGARSQQRPRAEPGHAGASRPTARAASASWCSMASTSTWSTTTSVPRSGGPRAAPTIRSVVQELKTNLKDVATYFHATAQKSKRVDDYQEAAHWYRDYLQVVPRTSRIPPRPTTCWPRRCSRGTSTPRPPPSTSTPPTAIRRMRSPRPPPTRRWSPTRRGKRACSGAREAGLARARHRRRA